MLQTYKTLLSKKTQLNSDTYLYHFDLIEPNEIVFKAGQYIILRVPSSNGFVTRLYSIASSPASKNNLELIIAIIPGGFASNYLFSLKENTEIIFYGVAGVFGIKENEKEKIFLITGTGIAPVISMIKSNIKDKISKSQIKNQKINLFWGMKTFKDIYMFDKLKQLNNETMGKFSFKICLSRDQNIDMIPEDDKKYFEIGHVDSCFEKQLTNNRLLITDYEFYLCGGRSAVESLRIFLLSKNVAKENIYFEKF